MSGLPEQMIRDIRFQSQWHANSCMVFMPSLKQCPRQSRATEAMCNLLLHRRETEPLGGSQLHYHGAHNSSCLTRGHPGKQLARAHGSSRSHIYGCNAAVCTDCLLCHERVPAVWQLCTLKSGCCSTKSATAGSIILVLMQPCARGRSVCSQQRVVLAVVHLERGF